MNSISRTAYRLIAAALFSGAAGLAHAGYTVSTISVPGQPAGNYTAAYSISNNDQVLVGTGSGTAATAGPSYLYNPSTQVFTPLPVDPAAQPGNTFFESVNNSGQLAGNYLPTNLGTYQSFLYSGGTFTNITPPASYQTDFSSAFGINDAGQVVGTWETQSDHEQGFELSGGVYTTIDVPGSGLDTEVYGINDNGVMVGVDYPQGSVVPSYGFEDDGGVFSSITVPGEANVVPYGINDNGVIVGIASNDENIVVGDVSFIDDNGTTTLFNIPGSMYTEIDSINDAGDLVGSYEDANGDTLGFLATPNGSASDASQAAVLLALGLLGVAIARSRSVRAPRTA